MEPGHIRLNSSSDDAAGDASVMVSYQERDCTDARSVPCPGDEVSDVHSLLIDSTAIPLHTFCSWHVLDELTSLHLIYVLICLHNVPAL